MSLPKKYLNLFLLLLLLVSLPALAGNADSTVQAKRETFIQHMVKKYQFDYTKLSHLFQQVTINPILVQAISNPYEEVTWSTYRDKVVNEQRIQEGVKFWHAHARELARAEKEYGVPAAIIVAIIGIESSYGVNTGKHRVIDALSTLAFSYPRRADFFQSELEAFLLLARDNGFDPLTVKGSYAGAMGIPQFMPSNYHKFGVDYSASGQVNLFADRVDAIGSIGNYLHHHGWKKGEPIAVQVALTAPKKALPLLAGKSSKPTHRVAMLRNNGLKISKRIDDTRDAILFDLPIKDGTEYWLGFTNYYTLTRYNANRKYALAVYYLSEKIQQQITF